MSDRTANDQPRSPLLPTDAFDLTLAQLLGLPNGAHTDPTVIQHQDAYGNTTGYILQTVKWDEGETVFVTEVRANGSRRFVLPPSVLRVLDRQRESTRTQVRRRHGKRLAEAQRANGHVPPSFTPATRAKALATRRAKARARKQRKGGAQ